MLSTGLSSSLTIALRELAASIPSLRKDISEGMEVSLSFLNSTFCLGNLN